MAFIRGSYETARVDLEEAAIAKESGNDLYYTWRRIELGYIVLSEGNLTRAQNLFTETIRNVPKRKNEIGVAFAFEGLAKFFVTVDKPEQTAKLLGWADAARTKIVMACLQKMGEAAFSDAYGEAVMYALREN